MSVSDEKNQSLRIEYIPLSTLRSHPKNPKEHHIGKIKESFRRFGFTSPIIMNEENGMLLAGHGRVKSLVDKKNEGDVPPEHIRVDDATGDWLVPVVRGIRHNAEDHEAYLIADNKLTELGGWDDDVLADLLKGLAEGDGLSGTGFSDLEAEALLGEKIERAVDALEAPESERAKKMELQLPFEHWDYVVFMFNDYRDYMQVLTALGIKKVDGSASRKGKKIGVGRVINGRKLLELIDGHHVAGEIGLDPDAQAAGRSGKNGSGGAGN